MTSSRLENCFNGGVKPCKNPAALNQSALNGTMGYENVANISQLLMLSLHNRHSIDPSLSVAVTVHPGKVGEKSSEDGCFGSEQCI